MKKPIIAITAGDINGVGYEVIIKALSNPELLTLCRVIVYGNAAVAKQHAATLDEEYKVLQWNIITEPQQAKDNRANILTCYSDETPVQLGTPTQQAGAVALASLQRAAQDIQQGLVDVLVTAPINKDTIQCDAFRYAGHTEYLTHYFSSDGNSLMMMLSERLRVALVCNHTPIAEIAQQITQDRIVQKAQVLNESLKNDFCIRCPRIAVLALNPHAGDNGLIGKEETDIIKPAIEQLNQTGVYAFGPYAADGFFGAGTYEHFDAVLAMYHDQGLAPFKSIDMNGVNYTAGLRIIRTSPDHGTAYDIAGKNQADPQSLLHAIYAATDIWRTRAMNKEVNSNPLKIEKHEDRKMVDESIEVNE